MRFISYKQAASVPNVIVDGKATDRTALTLSHWPKSGTPASLKADTSTAIVFKYLETPAFRVDADAVSNNHFDEDGLCGMFALVQTEEALRRRDLLIDVADAGDFGVYRRREAARIAMTLHAHGDPDRSPFPREVLERPYPELVAELYIRLLDVLPALLRDVEQYRRFWEEEDAALTASEAALAAGAIALEEEPALDFAVVRVPERSPACHPYAVNTRTLCTRVAIVHGRSVRLQYRYEGWVQMASRRPAARVDLIPLADELNQDERSGGVWVFDGVDEITPELHLEGAPATSISPDAVLKRVRHHLRIGPPAWDPYD